MHLFNRGFLNALVAAVIALIMSVSLLLHGYAAATHDFLVSHLSATQETAITPAASTEATTSLPASSTVATTATNITTNPKKTPSTKAPATRATQVASAPTQATPPPALLPTEEVNAQVRQSLVNILCTTQTGGSFATISGSGVIIDTRGVVLTNAHVGQYLLLRNYPRPDNINCILRTGSPAQATYTAELLYLPPAWIAANASQINAQVGTGTGENDYAFLRITGPVSPTSPYPAAFPALPMTLLEPSVGDSVLLAAYPAGFLDGITIQENLYSSSAVSTVKGLYTFASSTIDMISLSGTVVAQSGSSGGAAVSLTSGKLLGLIATEITATTTADRILHAITLAHIDRSLRAQGQRGIVGLLSKDPAQSAGDFNANVAPGLTAQLVAVLNKN